MKARASTSRRSQSKDHPWLLWLVCLSYGALPFVVSPAGLEKFRIPKDIVLHFFTLILLAGFLGFRKLNFQRLRNRWNLGLALLLGYVALHVVFLGRPQVSFPAFLGLLNGAILLILLVEIVDPDSQKTVWMVAAVAVAMNAVITVLEYFGLFPLMERMGGASLAGRLIPAGVIGEVNSGGFLFALFALLALAGILARQALWKRIFWASIFTATLLGLIFTRTLTAVVGISICMLIWIAWLHWWVFVKRAASRRWLVGFWAALLMGASLAALAASRAGLTQRIGRVVTQVSRGNLNAATAGRQPVYWLTLHMIAQRPFLGHGLASFSQDFFSYRADSEIGQSVSLINQPGAFRQVHNEYLQVWEELGLLGLLGWSVLLGILLWQALMNAIRCPDPSQALWRFHLFLGLVLTGVTSLTFFPFHVGVTAAFIVLLFASIRSDVVPREEPPAILHNFQEKLPALVFPAAALAVVLLAGWNGYSHWRANVLTGYAAEILEAARLRPAGRARSALVGQALAFLDRAEDLDPTILEIANLQGTGNFLAGRYDLSVAEYRQAAAMLPSPEVYTNLAAALMQAREKSEAREFLEKALRYNPEYAPAREALKTLETGT